MVILPRAALLHTFSMSVSSVITLCSVFPEVKLNGNYFIRARSSTQKHCCLFWFKMCTAPQGDSSGSEMKFLADFVNQRCVWRPIRYQDCKVECEVHFDNTVIVSRPCTLALQKDRWVGTRNNQDKCTSFIHQINTFAGVSPLLLSLSVRP